MDNFTLSSSTIFTVFYAIVFGGTLTRLSVWSAFWRDHKLEPWPPAIWRIFWSFIWFTLAPAAYLAWVLSWIPQLSLSDEPFWKSVLAAVGIFMAVLALVSFYRLWVAIVVWRGLDPRNDERLPKMVQNEGKWATLQRYVELGARNYIVGAATTGIMATIGLLILLILKNLCL